MTSTRDRLLGGLIAALALVSLAGCDRDGAQQTPVERARAAIASGDPEDARIILERALNEGVSEADVAAYLGEAAMAVGNLDEAARWLAGERFSDETKALGFRMLGRLRMAQGDLPAAGQAYDKSYAADPDNAELWVDIGRLRYSGGEQIQALEAAERAAQLDPGSASALRFRGQLARDAEGMVPGAGWFARALEANPADLDLRVEYAATLGDAGQAREALAVLREGNGWAATTPKGLYVQAVIAARGGNFLLARELLQRSGLDKAGMPSAMMLSGIIDLESENFASAAQMLDRLYRQQPDNGRVVDLFARALMMSGSERELVNRFADRAASPVGSPYLRVLVGRALEALGDRKAAGYFLDLAALGENGLAVLPTDAPGGATDGQSATGPELRDFVRSALTQRRVGAAVLSAREFVRRYPGSADAYGMLGDAEIALGNKSAALQAYLQAAKVRRPWTLTVRLAGSQSDPAAVRKLIEQYVRDNPANGEAAAILADAYASQGEWERAALLLDHAIALGQARVPWVVAARGVAAAQLDDPSAALAYALAAHELQPLNPPVIGTLVAVLPAREQAARSELLQKLASLMRR